MNGGAWVLLCEVDPKNMHLKVGSQYQTILNWQFMVYLTQLLRLFFLLYTFGQSLLLSNARKKLSYNDGGPQPSLLSLLFPPIRWQREPVLGGF